MNKKDQERLQELTLHVYAQVALNSLKGVDNPNYLTGDIIESHQGRIKKAIRLLEDAGVISLSHKNGKYIYAYKRLKSESKNTYFVLDMNKSKELAKPYTFNLNWYDYVRFSNKNYNSIDKMMTAGYEYLRTLPEEGILHVYWNKSFYDFHNTRVFPKVLLKERMKTVLRATVETKMSDQYTHYLADALGIDENRLSKDYIIFFDILNFSYNPSELYEEAFHNTGGEGKRYFEQAYESLDKIQNYISLLEECYKKIHQLGGFEKILEIMRRKIIDDIMDDIPFNVLEEDLRDFNQYILNNSDLYNYENLYRLDTKVAYIKVKEWGNNVIRIRKELLNAA